MTLEQTLAVFERGTDEILPLDELKKKLSKKYIPPIALLEDHNIKIKYNPLPLTKFQKILKYVCEKQLVPKGDILANDRRRHLVNARREIAYICMDKHNMSSTDTGRRLNMDHSSAIHLRDGWRRFIKIVKGKGKYDHLIGPYEHNFNWDFVKEYINEKDEESR